jgi:hypothetical protein
MAFDMGLGGGSIPYWGGVWPNDTDAGPLMVDWLRSGAESAGTERNGPPYAGKPRDTTGVAFQGASG